MRPTCSQQYKRCKMQTDDFWEWLDHGQAKGWISKITCVTHDFVEMTDQEMEDYGDIDDPCIPVVRLYAQETVI